MADNVHHGNTVAAVVVMDDDAVVDAEVHEIATVDVVEEQVIDDAMQLACDGNSMVSERQQQQVAAKGDESRLAQKQRIEMECFGGVISTSDEEVEVKDDKLEGVGATEAQSINANNDDNVSSNTEERSSENSNDADRNFSADYEKHDKGKIVLITEYNGGLFSAKERLENVGTLFCMAINHVEDNRETFMFPTARSIFNLAERSLFSDTYDNRMSLKNFHVGRQIGQGTYGKVFSAFINKKHVALKQCLRRKNRLENVMKERDMMIRLKHPYVCNLLGAFYDYHCYLVLEICVGRVMEARKVGSIRHVHSWVVQLLRAMEWIHGNEIIHCDLRPDNILVASNGCLKVSDFGTAQILATGITCIKRSRAYGVAAYQDATTNQEHLYSKSSDLFSVACSIFEIDTERGLQLYPRFPQQQKDVSVWEYVNCFNQGRKIVKDVKDLFNPNVPRTPLKHRIKVSVYYKLLKQMIREPRVGARKALLHDVLKDIQRKHDISDEMIQFGHPIAVKNFYNHESPIKTEHKKAGYGMINASMALLYYDAGVEVDNLTEDDIAYTEAGAKMVKAPEEDAVFKIRQRLLEADRNRELHSRRAQSSEFPVGNILIEAAETTTTTTTVALKKPLEEALTSQTAVEKVSEPTAQVPVVAKGKFAPPKSAATELAESISAKLQLPATESASNKCDPKFAEMIKAAMMQAIAEFNVAAVAPTPLELTGTPRTAVDDDMSSPRVETRPPPNVAALESEFMKYWAAQPPPPPVDTNKTTTTASSSVKGKSKSLSKPTIVSKTKGGKRDGVEKVSSRRSKDDSVNRSGKQPPSSSLASGLSTSVTLSTSKGGEKRKRSTSGHTVTMTNAAKTTPTVEAQPFKKSKTRADEVEEKKPEQEQQQQSEEELERVEDDEEMRKRKREAQRKKYEEKQMRAQKPKMGKQKKGRQTIVQSNSPEYECPVQECGYESVTEQEMKDHIARAHQRKQKKRHLSSSSEASE